MADTILWVILTANAVFLLYLVGDRILDAFDDRATQKLDGEGRQQTAEVHPGRLAQRKDAAAAGTEAQIETISLRLPPLEDWPVTWSVTEKQDPDFRLTRSRAFHASFPGLVEGGLGDHWKQAQVIVEIATASAAPPGDDRQAKPAAVGYGQYAADEANSSLQLNVELTLTEWAELLRLGVGDQDTNKAEDVQPLSGHGQWMAYVDIRGYSKDSEGVYSFLVEKVVFGPANAVVGG